MIRVKVQRQNILADLKVRVVKVIGDIETKRSELAALQQNTVVETQAEQQSLVRPHLLASIEFLLAEKIVEASQVVLQALGGLGGDLDGGLKNANWEFRMRNR